MESKESTEYLRIATEAYLNGNASEEQEKSLRTFLSESDGVGLNPELRALKTMFEGAESLSKVSFDTMTFADTCQKAGFPRAWRLKYGSAIAVAAAVALAVFVFAPEKQQVYGYDINGEAIMNVEDALANIGSMNLISEFRDTMDEAENIVNQLIGE